MRRNTSYGNLPDNQSEAKVLIIYTGGTIGMMRNEHNGELINIFFGLFSLHYLDYEGEWRRKD